MSEVCTIQPSESATRDLTDSIRIQSALNELVWEFGTDLEKRVNYDELLSAVGLERSQVGKKMLRLAEKEAEERILRNSHEPEEKIKNPWDILVWEIQPREDVWNGHQRVQIWKTEGGDYRIVEFLNPEGNEYAAEYCTPEGRWDIFESSGYSKTSPVFVTSLEMAMLTVEKFHSKRFKVQASSNREEVLAEERKIHCDEMNSEVTTPASTPRASKVRSGPGVPSKGKWDDAILAVLKVDTDLSPVQIKELAGIPKEKHIRSTLERLADAGKVILGFGKCRLVPPVTPSPAVSVPASTEVSPSSPE